mmetsp:Transcript_26120/g.37103  ORF Transcript_26120/g.37103 Transcript_26120/m.37103 type:complete len:205 (+) Transcript_26120:499-1113(+)
MWFMRTFIVCASRSTTRTVFFSLCCRNFTSPLPRVFQAFSSLSKRYSMQRADLNTQSSSFSPESTSCSSSCTIALYWAPPSFSRSSAVTSPPLVWSLAPGAPGDAAAAGAPLELEENGLAAANDEDADEEELPQVKPDPTLPSLGEANGFAPPAKGLLLLSAPNPQPDAAEVASAPSFSLGSLASLDSAGASALLSLASAVCVA